jgi:hypothetical protein
MDEMTPRTRFVRRALFERAYEPDETFVRDLLDIERLLAQPSRGIAGSMALSNLLSRYPKESDAIVREMGMGSFEPFEESRVDALMAERLRLAEGRHPLGRLRRDEIAGLFEF